MAGVETKSGAVSEMHKQAEVVRALMGGTAAMRAAGKTYLPQWPQETNDGYQIRLASSTLLPVLKETVGQMVGRVFFRDIDTEQVSDGLKPLLDDFDLQNNILSVFCAAWFADALAYGASYVLVDYPSAEGGRTLADDKKLGLRPYAVLVPNEAVLGFRYEMQGGQAVCTQFRYKQMLTENDGEFGEKTVEQINVLEPGRVRRYRQTAAGWSLYEDREVLIGGKTPSAVPVVELLPEKTGFFTGKPPLLELAHLNVKHWQSQSDQDNIVHYVRVPLLAYRGSEELGSIAAAAGNLLSLGADGEMRYVEHSGAAIEAGVNALDKLESDMQAAGAKLLTRTKLALTDSQARDEQGREISLLRYYANLLEDAVGRVLDWFARYQNIKGGGFVEISGNIDADFNPTASLDVLVKLNAAGVLSDQTLFEEAKRRGVVSNLAEWTEEQKRLESQEPAAMDFAAEKLDSPNRRD
ncbi:MAG: DUF4055 domain-containing protein [Neisseria sp.]|nr:DUF4055 domain-containing protein [Neisseria sp.]